MSSKHKGVAAFIIKRAKRALYIQCHAHRLNLVLVDVVKSVQVVKEFFSLLEKLYASVSGSLKHEKWINIQKSKYKERPSRELQKLSDIRWAGKYFACRAVKDRLPTLI